MIRLKNSILLLIFALFILLGSGCRVQKHHHPQYHKKGMIISTRPSGKMPPGQMKKAMGSKSAKAYAPGHNKGSKDYEKSAHKPGKQVKNKPHKYNKGHKRK